MCGSEAPASAIQEEKPQKPAANTEQTMAVIPEVDDNAQAEEEQAAALAEEEAERAAEAKRLRLLEEAEDAIIKHYAGAEILEYFLATNRAGKSATPLVSGAALFDAEN